MHQTTCLLFTNHLSRCSTKGHPDTLYGASTPPFKYHNSHNILPFCHYTSSTSLLQYSLIIFSTIWYVIFFGFFPCILLTPSHVAPSPMTTTLLSPPLAIHLLPRLYLAPTVEHYPLGLTFSTVPLVLTFGFRIRSLIHLSFHTATPASLFHSQSHPPPGRYPEHQHLPPSSHSTNSGCVKGPMSEGVL